MRGGVRRFAGVAMVCASLCATPLRAETPAPTPPANEPRPDEAHAPSAEKPPGEATGTPPAAPAPAPPTAPSTTKPARLALVGRTREHLIYIDKPTLRKLTSDKFELWAEVHSDGGERVKFLMQLNCGERSYLVKSEVVYGADGEVVENKTHRAPALQYVVPDSASEFIHEAVCRAS